MNGRVNQCSIYTSKINKFLFFTAKKNKFETYLKKSVSEESNAPPLT